MDHLSDTELLAMTDSELETRLSAMALIQDHSPSPDEWRDAAIEWEAAMAELTRRACAEDAPDAG